ncbi:MAG: hypothetical protein V7756_10835 [Halopseudomonas sp.]|uniref:hypothetical protein n=1 Tax=Halopseudomonas sp. TaxID=2901191 RepID=UPI003002BD74
MRTLLLLLVTLTLCACGASSPDERLNQAIDQLQESIESRDREQVTALLHPDFSAQDQFDNAWAERTLRLMFLQNQRIGVLVSSQETQIDPGYPERAETTARVTLTGAERFLPNSAGQYDIRLLWLDVDGQWLLRDIDWQRIR